MAHPRRHRPNQKFQKSNSNSLMPQCQKCPPGQYQPEFNQVKCLKCPYGMTSPRGAVLIDNCFDKKRNMCQNSSICGPHGVCQVHENGNRHLYSCLCVDGFTGKIFNSFDLINLLTFY